MISIISIFFIIVISLLLVLNFVSLPANWIVLGLVFLFSFFITPIPLNTLIIISVLAVLGELIEFLMQVWGGKKYGSSSLATLGGIIGSITGAILLLPLFFGLGAVLGALMGAYLGTFIIERLRGMETDAALLAAKGALIGRFLGIIIKFSFGLIIVSFVFRELF